MSRKGAVTSRIGYVLFEPLRATDTNHRTRLFSYLSSTILIFFPTAVAAVAKTATVMNSRGQWYTLYTASIYCWMEGGSPSMGNSTEVLSEIGPLTFMIVWESLFSILAWIWNIIIIVQQILDVGATITRNATNVYLFKSSAFAPAPERHLWYFQGCSDFINREQVIFYSLFDWSLAISIAESISWWAKSHRSPAEICNMVLGCLSAISMMIELFSAIAIDYLREMRWDLR